MDKIGNAVDWLFLLRDVAVDYDGFNTVEGLKGLIDELSEYAANALDCIMKGKINSEIYDWARMPK